MHTPTLTTTADDLSHAPVVVEGRLRPLTERQRTVLEIVRTSIRERGYPPTVREIASAIGVRSPSCIDRHLVALERHGLLRRERGARAIHVRNAQAVTP